MIELLVAKQLAKPVLALADSLVTPLMTRIKEELGRNGEALAHKIFGGYANYLNISYARHSFFHSIVFKNEQKKLLDFYIPLRIGSSSGASIRVNRFPQQFRDNSRTLIVDTAGMGKTTLLKFLFLRSIEERSGIPIFVELRKLSRRTSLLQFISDQLTGVEGRKDTSVVLRFLSSGKFIFFLDGYDEIPETERTSVTSDLQEFITRSPNNTFILSSRDELGLVAFPSFQRYSIAQLDKEEAFELLRKYGGNGPVANSLIEKLKLPENAKIHDFLTNPLLTSLLFKSFEFRHVIPLRKHIFYRQVYEALFEAHDLTKEGGEFHRLKRSGLAIDRFEKVLRAFGALTYQATKVELSRDEAIDFLEKAKVLASEPKLDCSKFLHDLTHAVPLMSTEGNYLRWSHRSIQEYFAAQYLCKALKDKTEEVLEGYLTLPGLSKHRNLLELAADIDRAAFNRSVGRKIATSLLSEWDNSYLRTFPGVSESEILERKSLVVGKITFLARRPPPELGDSSSTTFSEISSRILNRMQSTAGAATYTARMIYGDPGPGFIDTLESQIMAAFGQLAEWPFFAVIPSLALDYKNQSFLPNGFEAERVTDEPSSVLNQPGNFSKVNSCLRSQAMWTFNGAAAKEFLADLDNERSSRTALEPW